MLFGELTEIADAASSGHKDSPEPISVRLREHLRSVGKGPSGSWEATLLADLEENACAAFEVWVHLDPVSAVEQLRSELGAAMVSAVLAAGLTALPQAAGPVPERLARELRVRAMAGVGDTLADVLMGPLREVASSYLRDVPAPLDAAPRHVLDARPAALGGFADDVLTAAPRRA